MNFFELLERGLMLREGTDLRFFFLWYLVVAAASYLLGSVNTAVVVSKLVYKDDVRRHGSKNAGMTNMFRVFGKKAGFLTLGGDFLKAFLAVFVTMILFGSHFGAPYVAAFFCAFGHIFPVFYGFKGGKGVLIAAVSILFLDPPVFLLVAAVFALMFFTTRVVSLSSITAALLYPLISSCFPKNNFIVTTVFSLALGVFVVVMHKDNIRRLWNKEEPRVEFGKKKKAAEDQPAVEEKRSLLDDGDEDETN